MSFLNLKAVLSLNGSGFALGLKRAESTSKQFAKEIKSQFAQAFGAAAITAYGVKVVNMADDITDLSDRLEISTRALQEWSYAARKSGSSIEAVTRFLEQLAITRERAMGGDSDAMANLNAFGITDPSMGVDAMGRQIGKSIAGGNMNRSALKAIGGKGVGELIPALKDLEELSKSASVISDESLEALKQLKNEALGFADALMGPVAKAIIFIGNRIQDAMSVFKIGVGAIGAMASVFHYGEGDGSGKASFSDLKARFKQMGKAAMDVMDEELAAREKREKGIKERADNRTEAAAEAENASSDGPDYRESEPIKRVAEKAAQETMMNRPALNSWQQLGAAVRFNPNDSGTRIAKAAEQSVKEQRDIKVAIKELQGGDFGSGF